MVRLILISTGAALILTAALSLPGDSAVPAIAQCNPNRPNDAIDYYDGWQRGLGSDIGGIYSQIFNYSPYVSTSGFSTQYVKLKASSLSNLEASLGWRQYDTARLTWGQYRLSSTSSLAFFTAPAQPLYTWTYYTVWYDRKYPGKLTFQVNGSTIATRTNVQWVPRYSDAFGQITTQANQMPGGYADLSEFWDTHLWFNGSFKAYQGSQYSSDWNKFGNVLDGGSYNLSIWDFACAY